MSELLIDKWMDLKDECGDDWSVMGLNVKTELCQVRLVRKRRFAQWLGHQGRL